MNKLKTISITRGNIISIQGASLSSSADNGNWQIVPRFKGGLDNLTVRGSDGEYDGGDRVIGFPNGYDIDGDLLFTTGWGDGFAVRRLNNDGSLTKIYHDNSFLYRDTAGAYGHLASVALDKTNKIGVAMTYNVYGYTTFDYSGCTNGGTTFVKDARPSHSNPQYFIGSQDTSGATIRRVGGPYFSGLVAAGEWIYAGEYDNRHSRRVMRRNLNTGTEEIIGNSSGTGDLYSDSNGSSATIDRSGYRYNLHYDEINDRVFYQSFTNGNFILVVDASTSSPSLVWCDVADAGHGDDAYDQGVFIPDPTNAPNRLWIGASNRFIDVDITPCFSGNTMTVHNVTYTTTYFPNNPYVRMGTKYQKTSGVPRDKLTGYSNFVPLSADRGYMEMGGWIDTTNNHCVGFNKFSYVSEDTGSGKGRSIRYDYGFPAVLMESANGTRYWIRFGYSDQDGHRFITYEEDEHPNQLVGNWEIVFGTYTLDNSANIDFVSVSDVDNFSIPSGTSISIYVSNNNGTDWETYDKSSDTAHEFSTSGTQLRIKFSASGQPDKAPYYLGHGGDGAMKLIYGSLHAASKDANIKFKVNRKRLK